MAGRREISRGFMSCPGGTLSNVKSGLLVLINRVNLNLFIYRKFSEMFEKRYFGKRIKNSLPGREVEPAAEFQIPIIQDRNFGKRHG
jgi:hypothetical protein